MIPVLLGLLACGTPAEDSAAPLEVAPGCVDCALQDHNGFRYSATLTAAVHPGSSEGGPVVSWDSLTQDVHGHVRGVDFEVDQAVLLVFLDMGPDEVLARLSRDQLEQSDVSLTATCVPTGDRCAIADFRVLGRDLDIEQYYGEGMGTWLVLLRSFDEVGAASMVFVPPMDGGTKDVRVDDHTAKLDVDVDLGSLEPVLVAPGPDLTVRWSDLKVDGLGGPLALHSIDRLVVARYDSGLEALEERVFDLERDAVELWSAPVGGHTSADLTDLVGSTPFRGIDDQGTWVLWLSCTSCANPAPKFVTWLQPEAG
jgi:hypothetical protein